MPVIRRHQAEGVTSWASYSDCDTYRYALCRIWAPTGRRLTFVMLNPSRATELANDPTIGRCESRARRLGYGAMMVVNLFALRETDPRAMKAHAAPIGPATDAALLEAADWADDLIAAWGVHGVHLGRDKSVLALLRDAGHAPLVLGLTKAGHPRHPLYLPNVVRPMLWAAP